jgi:hypothetical protein
MLSTLKQEQQEPQKMPIRLCLRFSLLILAFPAVASAATYYVRSGGDDSADGRTPETAWATVDKVNSYSFGAGDSVLFHEGDSWNRQLVIDWSGTPAEQAVVGAYYLESGQARRGFRTARPSIDGKGKIPDSRYVPLVHVLGNRVRVENLSIVNSNGRGIVFDGVVSGEAVNLTLSNIFDGAIKFLKAQKGLAENNTITNTDVGYPKTGEDWSAAISAVRSSDSVIRNNRISQVFGEGINVFQNSPRSLIERNVLFGARAVSIYADAAPDTTIRYNIVIGTAEPKFWRGGDSVGPGIVLNNEKYHYESAGGPLPTNIQTKNAKIYGNLVAFTSEGIGIWGALPTSSFDNTQIYNNTLVDNDVQFEAVTSAPMPGSQFVNNILLSLSAGTRDVTKTDVSGLATKSNYFSQGDPGGTLSNAGNVYAGIQLRRMSGWRSVTDPRAITAQDFEPAAGSPTIGAGDKAPLEKSDKTNTFNLDFHLAPHRAPPDMGALRFGDQPSKVPGRPANLSGSAKGSS